MPGELRPVALHRLVPVEPAPYFSGCYSAAMKAATRHALLVTTLILLALVLIAWWASLPRPTYNYASTLARIDYVPAGTPGDAQALTYSFLEPLGTVASDDSGPYSAFLQAFTVTSVDPPSAGDAAAALVAALLAGSQLGGTPFVPAINESGTTLSTNAVPPEAVQAYYPRMAISGYGTMAFVTG